MTLPIPGHATRAADPVVDTEPLLTIFSLPKAFHGEANRAQRNALASWKALGPRVQIMIGGDDDGVKDAADEFGATYLGPLRRNDSGTPYLDELFGNVQERSKTRLLLYVNADILLFDDLLQTAECLLESEHSEFLAIGRRLDLDVDDELPLQDVDWRHDWTREVKQEGTWAPAICKDYFLFTRGLYHQIPPFLVGRGNWDNWMVHHAKSNNLPVIDVTHRLLAIHQNHGYAHLSRGRLEAYVTGPEAKHNERVGGGKYWLQGAAADWELTAEGTLHRVAMYKRLVAEVPPLVRLVKSFFAPA